MKWTFALALLIATTGDSRSAERQDIVVAFDESDAKCELPDLADIGRIDAELYQNPNWLPDVGRFDVPKGHWPTVLGIFEGAGIDKHPKLSANEIGCIRVHVLPAGVHTIPIYWEGKHPIWFSHRGVRYRGFWPDKKFNDQGLGLDGRLRSVYVEVMQLKDKDAERMFQQARQK